MNCLHESAWWRWLWMQAKHCFCFELSCMHAWRLNMESFGAIETPKVLTSVKVCLWFWVDWALCLQRSGLHITIRKNYFLPPLLKLKRNTYMQISGRYFSLGGLRNHARFRGVHGGMLPREIFLQLEALCLALKSAVLFVVTVVLLKPRHPS